MVNVVGPDRMWAELIRTQPARGNYAIGMYPIYKTGFKFLSTKLCVLVYKVKNKNMGYGGG
jgi:hypothetical protein